MKNQNFVKKLHKPVHPMWGKTVLGVGILFAAGALAYLLQRGPMISPATNTPPTKVGTTLPTSTPTQQVAMYNPMPTPTLAPGQKANYTFYIQATSHKTSPKVLGLAQTDTGKAFIVDIGTFIIVNFGRVGKFQLSQSSPQDIFKGAGSKYQRINLPNNAIGAYTVIRAGSATITVVELN